MDLGSGFCHWFMMCSYVVARCIIKSITKALGATQLLALTKLFGGIWPIAIGKKNYQLTNKTFYFLLLVSWCIYRSLILPPIWGVIMGGCEIVVHNMRTTLDVHLNWALPTFVLEETHIKDYINFMKNINVIAQNANCFYQNTKVLSHGKNKLVDNYIMFC